MTLHKSFTVVREHLADMQAIMRIVELLRQLGILNEENEAQIKNELVNRALKEYEEKSPTN